jgi:hypothetical protein
LNCGGRKQNDSRKGTADVADIADDSSEDGWHIPFIRVIRENRGFVSLARTIPPSFPLDFQVPAINYVDDVSRCTRRDGASSSEYAASFGSRQKRGNF